MVHGALTVPPRVPLTADVIVDAGDRLRLVVDTVAQVGEHPVWSAEERALYWIDVRAPALHRFDPRSGRQQTWRMPEPIGSYALRRTGGAIVALKTGLFAVDLGRGAVEPLVDPEPDQPDNRLNDGKVSPDGRFFFGSMSEHVPRRATGALYRYDPDGRCSRLADGYVVCNGLAWSPDGRTLYHSDSRACRIDAWDYDAATGAIANRRRFAEPGEADGRPDGAATDADGCYWSAGVSAGCLNQFGPDGRLRRKWRLPIAQPTCVGFGGDDLRTLYITAIGGGLYAMDSDVAGVPVSLFG
ncbi:MAG: SMP-30/gluconolactonase/LRE family protein [Lautropia sp.]